MRQTIHFECIPVEVVVPVGMSAQHRVKVSESSSLSFLNRCYLCSSPRAEVSLLHAWLLAFTKSFTSFVSCVFGLLTTRLTSETDFVNAKTSKSQVRDKLKNCSRGMSVQFWFTCSQSARFSYTQNAFFAYIH